MSWFKRSPRKNEPSRTSRPPQTISPMTQQMLDRAKLTGPKQKNKKSKTD